MIRFFGLLANLFEGSFANPSRVSENFEDDWHLIRPLLGSAAAGGGCFAFQAEGLLGSAKRGLLQGRVF